MQVIRYSAIFSTFIKLPFVIKIFVLSIFEWPFYTGFTVFLSLKIFFLTNSADPDEMPPYVMCGISSGSSLLAKVPVYQYPE